MFVHTIVFTAMETYLLLGSYACIVFQATFISIIPECSYIFIHVHHLHMLLTACMTVAKLIVVNIYSCMYNEL